MVPSGPKGPASDLGKKCGYGTGYRQHSWSGADRPAASCLTAGQCAGQDEVSGDRDKQSLEVLSMSALVVTIMQSRKYNLDNKGGALGLLS